MNAEVQSNRKAELLSSTVEHVAIDQYDARPIIDAMRQMSFTSRDTARAADIFSMALEDPTCSTWLTLAGSTSAGGCMHIYRDMVKYGLIDAVVATGASIVQNDALLHSFSIASSSAASRAPSPSMLNTTSAHG